MNYNLSELNNENIIVKGEKTPYLTFRRFNELPYIRHCFTTRAGGVSEGIFSSLNLSFSRGDDILAVKQNYVNICDSVGLELENIVMSDQIHKTTVLNITQEVVDSLERDDFSRRKLCDVDGMVTELRNVPLFTYYADCVPLYFVDTKKRAVGLSHSGWRGTAGLMGLKTIEKMEECFGTVPKDLVCAIGPSICQECYEVSEDVIAAINSSFLDENVIDSTDELKNIYYRKDDGKYQLNLWKANAMIMKRAGVLPENIIISGICTCHNSELLFSHRATQGKRGNLAAAIQII